MYFIDGFVALADRLGMVPDDVLVLSFLLFASYAELLSWFLVIIYRILRWLFRRLFRWLRSRRKKLAD